MNNPHRKPAGMRTAIALAAGFALVAAAYAQTDTPATRPAPPARPIAVTLPYSLLDDLTEAQRTDIIAVRTDTVARMRALQAEERDRILAVLTDAQRERLPDLDRAYQRDRAAERRGRDRDAAAAPDQPGHAREATAGA